MQGTEHEARADVVKYHARVSGQDVTGLILPPEVGDVIELPEHDHTTFRVVRVSGETATLVQHPGDGEEWLVCPKCGSTDVELTETYTAYRRTRMQDGTLVASGWDTDDGAADYELACTHCPETWPLGGLPLDFE